MLYIRTDMNDFIATGHVMRCLAIADAAAELGEDTVFLLADRQAVGLIGDRGYRSIVLHTQWNHMDAEMDVLKSVIRKQKIQMLLVDSYMVTPAYLRVLSELTSVAYLDDLNAFDYPVQTIICYANYWKKFGYKERYEQTKLLLGPKYVPLRRAYANAGFRKIRRRADNILILSGGTDNFGFIERMLHIISKMEYRNIEVICGAFYVEYDRLCRKFGQYSNIHIYKNVTDMENYMLRADIAVSAGGTSLYELCACGTPTISYAVADNQLANVEQFQKDRLIDYVGDIRNTDIFEKVELLLCEYGNNYQLRQKRSEKMQKLVDGKGAERIAREFMVRE